MNKLLWSDNRLHMLKAFKDATPEIFKMRDEYEAKIAALIAERDDALAKLAAAQAELDELRIWAHFAEQTASNMMRDLPNDALRQIYAPHVRPVPQVNPPAPSGIGR